MASRSTTPIAGVKKGPGTGVPVKPGVPVTPASPGLSAFGQTLTTPASPSAIAPSGVTGDIATALMKAQNQANQANNQRYGQGLGVLAGGYGQSADQYNQAQGSISSALGATAGMGTAAKQNIALNLQNAQGATAQSAVNRGIGNTTVVDALQQGNQRVANNATQAVNEGVANQQIGLYQNQANIHGQQAQNANQGAGSIANFIAQRNDVAPNPAQYAQLQQNAAAGGGPNQPPAPRIRRDGLGREIIDGGTTTFGGTGMFTLH